MVAKNILVHEISSFSGQKKSSQLKNSGHPIIITMQEVLSPCVRVGDKTAQSGKDASHILETNQFMALALPGCYSRSSRL